MLVYNVYASFVYRENVFYYYHHNHNTALVHVYIEVLYLQRKVYVVFSTVDFATKTKTEKGGYSLYI